MPGDERCAGCGLRIARSTDGCQALFDEFRAREMSELAPNYAWTRLSLDVYCLQHPDRYCVSAKSLAAHLTGLAWALEQDGSEAGLRLVQRWLNSPGPLQKPPLPGDRGALTIEEVARATSTAAYQLAVRRWAESAWAAYRDLQPVARAWLTAAGASARS